MPHLGSIITAVDRLGDFAAVNDQRSGREKAEAFATLNESLGVSADTLAFVSYIVSISDLSDKTPVSDACALVLWGMALALTALQVEAEDESGLAA